MGGYPFHIQQIKLITRLAHYLKRDNLTHILFPTSSRSNLTTFHWKEAGRGKGKDGI
jgi:hypothetical protein